MRRSLLLVFAGVLFVSAPRAFAQDAGASIRDTTVLDLLNRGKPPVRAATSRVVGQPLGSLSLVEIMNQGKPSTSYWPNIGAPKERGKAAFWLFGGPTASDFPQLESVACDQLAIVSCSVDRFSFGPRAGVLWWPWWRRPFGFGVSGGKSSVSVTQQWEEVPFPETVVTELDVYTATAFFDAWHSFNRQTRIIGTVGLVWAWNRARITEFFPGDTIVTHRNDDGGRWTIGASLERDITRDTRIRFEYRFIDGEAGDADRQHQFGILFGWAPGGHVPTREPAPPPITRYAEPPPIGPDGREPRPISRPPIIFPVGDPEVGGPPDDGTLPPPPTDSDDDGVPDDVDQCPRTPPGRTVDERGCEPGEPPPPTSADSDDDGVPDDVDRCPRTPPGRTVDERGCEPGEPPPPPPPADSDDDGVPDDVDQCPSTPPGRTVDERGCEPGEPPPPPPPADTDDGVRRDGDDDRDGVINGHDACPDTRRGAVVDERGCEVNPDGDDDNDGVTNQADRCPGTPPAVPVDARGCPGPGGEVARALPMGTFQFTPPDGPVLANRPHEIVLRVTPANPDSVDTGAVSAAIGDYVIRTGVSDTIFIDVDANRIADSLVAELVGPPGSDWAIDPPLPRMLPIPRDTTTEWRWQVTPRCTPLSRLSLSTSCVEEIVTLHVRARIDVDGGPIVWQPQPEPIAVRVTRGGAVLRFGRYNWWWLWIPLFAPIGVVAVRRWRLPPVPIPVPPRPPFPPRGTRVIPRPDLDGEFEDIGDPLDEPEEVSTPVGDPGKRSLEASEDLVDESQEVVQRPVLDPGARSLEKPDALIDEERVIVHRPLPDPGEQAVEGAEPLTDEETETS